MLSAVARYKQLLSSALARYFPRTTAYLRAEREAAQPRNPVRKQSRKKPAGNGKTGSRKAASGKPGPGGIYPAARLKIEDAQVQAMRERVARAVNAGLIGAPSDEQWAMILCRAPLARIFAGAGSGKSSTLVLRVVFLLCHLDIEPGRLTVISFTNASCMELRERLQRLLDFWHYPHDARQCVRTFHAAMATLIKERLDNPRWFEQLDDPGEEPDNPLAGGRLRPAQQRLLRQAYQNAYAEDARFRTLSHRLLGLPAPEEQPKGKAKAPLDACKLPGEFTALPLFELLHGQIDFAESLGIRLDRLDVKTLACAARERDFIEAMQRFHQHFTTLLRSQGLIGFNGAFAQLSEHLQGTADDKPSPALLALSHLLIDEFQDVSPQIVSWIRASLREIRSRGPAMHVGRGAQRSSLLCVGDDWQSIYGWRGSSPKFFMEFNKEFPSPATTRVMLSENYRSHQHIIDAAEHIVRAAPAIGGKKAKASGEPKEVLPVNVLDRDDQGLAARLAEHYRNGDSILMLFRKSSDKSLIEEHILPIVNVDSRLPAEDRRLKQLTYHSSKGLQADAVFLLGDCQHLTSSPYKNQVYRMAGLGKDGDSEPYDNAQKDETLRLAYVGITRAVKHCYWYVDRPDTQAANAPKASDRVPQGKPFFADLRA